MSRVRARVWLALPVVLLAEASVAQQPHKPSGRMAKPSAFSSGAITDGVYRNPSFGCSYKIPFGWVDRTAEMQESDTGQDSTDPAKAQVLLGVFERPPEATGETVNSTVVIAAESISSYPGLKTAADYFGPLEEVVTAKGFKVVNEPYEFPVGAKQLARADFSKELGKLTMRQASLVMLQKGYVVSFTFIGGSEDEVDELLGGLTFAAAQRSGSPHSPAPTPPSTSPPRK
jgi:hypothetical protein